MAKILLVDDDVRLTASIKRGLVAEGMSVEVAHDGLEGRDLALRGNYDVVVLDIMLPGRNGYQICADIRAAGSQVPVMMLTAKDGEHDEAEGLDTGADDYITKPFSYTVLVARLRALLRRSTRERGHEPLELGGLTVIPAARRVLRDGAEVELTTREFDVLLHLVEHAGRVLSKWQILEAVWDQAFDGDPNIVEVYISRLRRRLGGDAITTVRGVGYRLDVDA